MRVLVAGWHGQVATALVAAAARRDDVTALALGRPALDLCTPASVASALGERRPDVIINTAAYTAVDQAEAEPDAARRLNCDGAGLIAREAARHDAPIIHLSTDYVFDGTADRAYRPNDPTCPINVYGETKRDGEEAVRAANPRHVIVRTSWVHSPTGKNFVKTMLHLSETRDELRIVGDQIGCPTYAPHLADALLDAAAKLTGLASDAEVWGTYHAAGAGETSWAGLAEHAFSVSRAHGGPSAAVTHITTEAYPTPAARPRNSRLDCTTFADAFATSLPDWTDGVADGVRRLLDGREAASNG